MEQTDVLGEECPGYLFLGFLLRRRERMGGLHCPRERLQACAILPVFIEDFALHECPYCGNGLPRFFHQKTLFHLLFLSCETEIGIQDLPLLRGTGERRFCLVKVNALPKTEISDRAGGVVVVRNARRQGGNQHFAEGAHIVVGDPLPETQLLGRDPQTGGVVQDINDLAERDAFAEGCGVLTEHYTCDFLRSNRY